MSGRDRPRERLSSIPPRAFNIWTVGSAVIGTAAAVASMIGIAADARAHLDARLDAMDAKIRKEVEQNYAHKADVVTNAVPRTEFEQLQRRLGRIEAKIDAQLKQDNLLAETLKLDLIRRGLVPQ